MIMCIDFKTFKLDKWMETFNFFVKILLFKNASQFNAA